MLITKHELHHDIFDEETLLEEYQVLTDYEGIYEHYIDGKYIINMNHSEHGEKIRKYLSGYKRVIMHNWFPFGNNGMQKIIITFLDKKDAIGFEELF